MIKGWDKAAQPNSQFIGSRLPVIISPILKMHAIQVVRRNGREVDCTALEKRHTERYLGFESLFLRKIVTIWKQMTEQTLRMKW
jgi:hypothetical protein